MASRSSLILLSALLPNTVGADLAGDEAGGLNTAWCLIAGKASSHSFFVPDA
ncbi:hypothetical protein D3C79_1100770 [compost metagenome]